MSNFWKNFFISLAIPGLVCLASANWVTGPDAGKWTLAYTLTSGIISVLFLSFSKFAELQREFNALLLRFNELSQELASRITRDEIFKTNAVAQDLLRIAENDNPLFAKIASVKLRELRICLEKLKNREYIAQGAEVYSIYTSLISELGDGDEYMATTYTDDPFWTLSGSTLFLDANYSAICLGAKIIRVFLCNAAEDLGTSPAIQKHLELLEKIKGTDHEDNLQLFTIQTSKVAEGRENCVAEDKGILKNIYVMSVDQDRSGWQKATISIARDILEEEKLRFANLLGHKDLQPFPNVLQALSATKPANGSAADRRSGTPAAG
jgi:hypothetical protein